MTIKKLDELPDGDNTLSDDDVFLVMDDPAGSGVTKKISLNQLKVIVGNGESGASLIVAPDWTPNHTLADGTRYLTNDVVYYNGNIYRALHDNESMPVSNTVYWENLGPGSRLNIDGRDILNIPYPVKSINGQTGDVLIESPYDQELNTTNNVIFNSLQINGDGPNQGNLTAQYVSVYAGGTTISNGGITFYADGYGIKFFDNTTQTTAWTGSVNIENVNDLQTVLNNKQPIGNYATLVNGTVPASQLPSFVDDILEYPVLSSFPSNGETGKIYIALDNNKTYRWSGSTYVEIPASPGSTDSIPEGSINKYYTDSRASSAAPVQSVNGKTGAVTIPVYPIRAYIVGGMISLSNISNNSYNTGLPIVYSNDIPNFNYVPLKLSGSIEYGQTSILVNCQSNLNKALLDFPGTYVSYSSLEVVLVDADNKIVGWATSATSPAPMPTHGSDGYKLTINLFDFPDLTNVPDTWVLTNPSNSINQYEGRIFTDPVAYKQISSRFIDNLEHDWKNIPNDPVKNITAGTNVSITNNNGNFTIASNGLVSNPTGISGASAINNIVQISQTNYDALVTKDPNTFYIITS